MCGLSRQVVSNGSGLSRQVSLPRQVSLYPSNSPISLFPVDASQAGRGEMIVEVQGPSTRPRVDVSPRGVGHYDVTFTPTEPGGHSLHVTFNRHQVPGMYVLSLSTSALDLLGTCVFTYGKIVINKLNLYRTKAQT